MLSHILSIFCLVTTIVALTLTNTLLLQTSTYEICTTRFSSQNLAGAIPTTVHTKTKAADIVIIITTSHPTVVVTPSPSTTTLFVAWYSVFFTSIPAIIDAFSTTSTEYATSTITSTITSPVTITATATTTTTSTLIIPTSSGFIPIDDSSGSKNMGQKKREAGHPHGGIALRAVSPVAIIAAESQHPAAVTCTLYYQPAFTEQVVITGKKKTSTLPVFTILVTSTLTYTTTSTLIPIDIPTVLSFSVTSTTTHRTTTTLAPTTTTTTILTATASTSVYAACATNNLLGPQMSDGDYIWNGYYPGGNVSRLVSPADSSYACCVACITNTACQFSAYDPTANWCLNVVGTAGCSAGYNAGYTYDSTTSDEDDYVISNGNCGVFSNGGIH